MANRRLAQANSKRTEITYFLWAIDDGTGMTLESWRHGFSPVPIFFNTKYEALSFSERPCCSPENLYKDIAKPWPKIKIKKVEVKVKSGWKKASKGD